MGPKSLDDLPIIVADMESLQHQLRELHAAVKAKVGERREQADQPLAVGLVIKGK